MVKREKELIREINRLKKTIGAQVDKRVHELRNNSDWYSEMCFCLMTANYTAEGGIRIQKKAGDFSKMSLEEIRALLKKCGHRFPNARAGYIHESKKHKQDLASLAGMASSGERREWLVQNVKGLGYKEASHLLRNIGFMDVAIIDRHILNLLAEYGLIRKPKNLNRARYLEIEQVLEKLAKKTKLPQGELDFYLWYMKTGKILK